MDPFARLARPVLVLVATLGPQHAAALQEEPRPRLEGLAGAEGALQSAALEDVSALGLAFVELVLERDTVLVGEAFALHLRFGFEPEFLRSNLVQLFQRELDVPAQLFAPELEALDGALALPPGEPADGVRVALGESVVRALPRPERTLDGRRYREFELVRRFVATRPGELVLAAPRMRFAQATRFEDDFVQGRRALDRRDVLVRGRALRLAVQPLPEAGRPAEFSGAIGQFTLRVEAEPRELAAGESLALRVVVERQGELGDLSHCEAPRLDALAGFHLRGSLAEREPGRLTVRYDLVPADAGVRTLPPVRFVFFDPTPPAGYRTLASEPIALQVRPAARSAPDAPSAPSARDGTADSGKWALALIGLAGLVLLALLAVQVRARRSRRIRP